MSSQLLDAIDEMLHGQPLLDVAAERVRQNGLWGRQDHAPKKWLAILVEEVGEVAAEIITDAAIVGTTEGDMYREELVHVAAVAVAAVESYDRAVTRILPY
jgi:NTP pyrophosphatase (non-canonical NTP hydrolase)